MGHLPMQHGIDFHPALSRVMAEGSTMMGMTAELLARHYAIGREEQDRFALRSHQLASAAQNSGALAREIVPMEGHDPDGGLIRVMRDEVVREQATLESLSRLPPVFDPHAGSITAGNASALSDGAAALLLMSQPVANALGITPLAYVRATSVIGCEPARMGLGPVPAIAKVLARAGLQLADISRLEINEAFAAQTLACLRELEMEDWPLRLNSQGGAIALGHPLGCSGARLLTTLSHQLQTQQGQFGIASMCIGLGQGIATLLERAG